MNNLLEKATQRSIRYIDSLEDRRVFPSSDAIKKLSQFEESFSEKPSDPELYCMKKSIKSRSDADEL